MVPEQLIQSISIKIKAMRTISGTTSLVGVLGSPVRHSLSPIIHNAALDEMGLDWCYLAIPCEPQYLKSTVEALSNMNCKGLNITIPHKEKSLNLCNEISVVSRVIGAINTLIPDKKGGWTGDNTDIEGFLEPLKNQNWQNKTAMILGSGGSSRAVITGIKKIGFKNISVVGRNKNKLNNLIKEMNLISTTSDQSSSEIKGILQEDLKLIEYVKNSDLIVNATPIGMSNTSTEVNMPLGSDIWRHLKKDSTLYDLIYTPRPTEWLRNGAKMNCNIIDGLDMLIHQGAASLRLWSDFKEIPIRKMKYAALNYLNS